MSLRQAGHADAFAVDPRSDEPGRRLDAYRAVTVAAVVALLYVAALGTKHLPPTGLAVAFFAAAPLLCVVALLVVTARARATADTALAWFGTGLLVGLGAMVLQFLAFPLVAEQGGLLGTDRQSSAALYLVFHLAAPLAAVAGALEAPARLRTPVLLAGLLLDLLVAANLVPLPELLGPTGGFTPALVTLEWVVVGVVAVCTVVWALSAGRTPASLRGWAGVALSLMAYDVALNALGAQRFSAVWWASLSLRVGSYAVLGLAAVQGALGALRDLESYATRELGRREAQLQRSLGLTSRLLTSAGDLAAAVTTADVAAVLSADALAAADGQRAVVLLPTPAGDELTPVGDTGRLSGTGGWRVPWTDLWRDAAEQAVFLDEVNGRAVELPGLGTTPFARLSSLAMLPLPAGDGRVGLLVVGSHTPAGALGREVLHGLAAQGGQAVARALAFESEREAAETLQRSLLPAGLPVGTGLAMAARYLPGERGVQVGGDWYDVVQVSRHEVALVVGDVMGKGLHAAAVMGQLRTALRALAVADPAPAAVLHGLDRLTRELDVDEIATIAYVLVDLRSATARVARAGHLPPLLVSPGCPAELVEGGGSPPLGAPATERPEHTVAMLPGSLWVLYTDGLVEDRDTGLDRGLPELVRQVGLLHGELGLDAEAIATRLLTGLSGEGSADDVALLLAGFAGASTPVETSPAGS